MKRILGLDLGPNSIGWAVVEKDEADGTGTAQGSIAGAGSRIIPMDAATQGDFDKGNSVSQTKERTQYRSQRRLRERHQLRRERLNRMLDVMGFLPTHYSDGLDRYGKFKDADGRKIAWREEPDGSRTFIFAGAYAEILPAPAEEQEVAHSRLPLRIPHLHGQGHRRGEARGSEMRGQVEPALPGVPPLAVCLQPAAI